MIPVERDAENVIPGGDLPLNGSLTQSPGTTYQLFPTVFCILTST